MLNTASVDDGTPPAAAAAAEEEAAAAATGGAPAPTPAGTFPAFPPDAMVAREKQNKGGDGGRKGGGEEGGRRGCEEGKRTERCVGVLLLARVAV